jgi:hypothetical protein
MSKRNQIHPGLQGIVSYTTLGTLPGGQKMAPDEFIMRVSQIPRQQGFVQLACWAAQLAHGDGVALNRGAIALLGADPSPAEVKMLFVRVHQGEEPAFVLHEAMIYFLQAHVLHYGLHEGKILDNKCAYELAYLALAGGDYLSEWQSDEDNNEFSRRERNMIQCARSLQYDRQYSSLHDLARGFMLFEERPPRDPIWSDSKMWSRFSHDALGMEVNDYLAQLVGPIFMLASLWGTEGKYVPLINPRKLFSLTSVSAQSVESFFDELSLSVECMRGELQRGLRADGLMISPVAFIRNPFVRFSDELLVAASPWVVKGQLRAGLWARHLSAARKTRTAEAWLSAFGDLFEVYCRKTTSRALEGIGGIRVRQSAAIGDEHELEDIVLVSQSAIAVIAVKASTAPEYTLKGARSMSDALQWFERFFFGRSEKRSGRHYRDGVVRIMNRKVGELLRGEWGFRVRGRTVCPVVVTYDKLGTDNYGLYRWLEKRVNEEGLDSIKKKRVGSLTILNIDEYEEALSALAQGVTLKRIFGDRAQDEKWKYAPMSTYLRQRVLPGRRLVLEFLENQMKSIEVDILSGLNLLDTLKDGA